VRAVGFGGFRLGSNELATEPTKLAGRGQLEQHKVFDADGRFVGLLKDKASAAISRPDIAVLVEQDSREHPGLAFAHEFVLRPSWYFDGPDSTRHEIIEREIFGRSYTAFLVDA